MSDDRRKARPRGSWIALGVGVGVAIGVALDNIAVGIGVGVAIGVALSATLPSGNRPDGDD